MHWGPPICRNNPAITPKWFNSLDTNSILDDKSWSKYGLSKSAGSPNFETDSTASQHCLRMFTKNCIFLSYFVKCLNPEPKNLTITLAIWRIFVNWQLPEPEVRSGILLSNYFLVKRHGAKSNMFRHAQWRLPACPLKTATASVRPPKR